jgi:hypothetical protein
MVGHPLRGLKRTQRKSRTGSLARPRRGRRPWLVEGLEDRLLLSGSPTIYTVNSTGNSTTGTGDSGTLPYVIGQANANTNTAGSEIQFDPTVFASPQTITLASTLELSKTAGPEVIDGPGASIVTVSGDNAVEVFSVTSGVTASLKGLTISGGRASRGGGLSVVGGTVSLTNVSVINNHAVGADGATGEAGGSARGGGIYLNGGSLTLKDDTVASDVGHGGDGFNTAAGSGGSAAGGGIYVANGGLVLNTDVFESDEAIGGAGAENNYEPGGGGTHGGSASGGGIYVAGGSIDLYNDKIELNQAIGGATPSPDGPYAATAAGGGLFVTGATLTMNSATIANNTAGGDFGQFQIGQGGGIFSDGTVTVNNTTIDGNSGTVGGGIENSGTLTVTNCTIAANSARSYAGGGIDNGGKLTITNSTVADNSAASVAGGINNNGTLMISNSTVADNSVASGSGGGITDEGTMTVVNSTVAYNNVASGESGGLDVRFGVATLDNTIVVLNTTGSGDTASASDIAGTVVTSSAYNLIGTGGAGGLTDGVDGNEVGVADPGLGTLANNGGPSQTIALLTGSPAIDEGSNALTVDPSTLQALTIDQRGLGFSRIVNNTVDIGAFEFQTTPTAATRLVITVQPPSTVFTGSAFGLVVSVVDRSGVVSTSFNGTITVALPSNPGGGTLGGILSVTAMNGVATFSGLTIDQVGAGYMLHVSANGLTAATTGVIDVQSNTVPTHYTVDLTGDTGAGSGSEGDLRYVIVQADADTNSLGRVIQFDPMVFSSPQTIILNYTLPDLSNATGLTDIEWNEATSLTVARSSAAGTLDFGIFIVDTRSEVKLVGLTITGGASEIGASGIDNMGTLTVANSTIAANNTVIDSSGGGIFNSGMMTVTNSTIDDNSSEVDGGAIWNLGTMTVTNSTIADNTVGFLANGGGIFNSGTMSLTNSTVAGNTAGPDGTAGGIYNLGTMTVTNSTVADNSGGGGIASDGNLTVTNTTIAYNNVASGGAGGGLNVIAGTAILDNAIVALNTTGTGSTASASDIAGAVASASAYNLIGTGGTGGLTNGTNGNQVGVANPELSMLAKNGGPTQTIALLPGSPAIDKGSNALAMDPTTGQPLVTDQRGPGFIRVVNGTVDIGAYEFTPDADDVLSVGWGTQTAALQTAADGLRLLPAGRATDIPWLGINQLPITLSQAYALTAADVFISSAFGVNYGPVTVSGSGTNYIINLAQPINAADLVTLIVDNPGVSVFYRQLDVLPGDFNDDGVVNSQDLAGIRNEWLGVGGAKPTIFGDINGDGLVNVLDYNAERLLIGTSLPSVSAALSAAGPASQGGPALVRIGTTGSSPRSTASPAVPRAEIQLSGRGWSLGTSTMNKTISQALIKKSTSRDAAV